MATKSIKQQYPEPAVPGKKIAAGALDSARAFTSSSMFTLAELFERNLFRIPDYQRGYSWQEEQLDDFWQDLMNLQKGRTHYTGLLTLEPLDTAGSKKWNNERWLLEKEGYKPYAVVDGQQRLTTIIIFLKNLAEQLDVKEKFAGYSAQQINDCFLFRRTSNGALTAFLFGYEEDDPSYEYLKHKIFGEPSFRKQPETTYTNNLLKCDEFFRTRLIALNHEQRQDLFIKLVHQLKFDVKLVGSDLDLFVVFETTNNRGKELTNLERLKNRLIYLSTIMPRVNKAEAERLREEINEVWKTCYEYLGKNKKNVLDDDIFLRNHFICYHFFNKDKGFPYHHLFKDIYTVQNTVNRVEACTYKEIRRYILSLRDAARQWYILNNPKQAESSGLLEDPKEKDWLVRLNRLGYRIFGPLALAAYLQAGDAGERVNFLQAIESYIFLVFCCAGRKSTMGMAEFATLATKLYNGTDNADINGVIELLDIRTWGDEEDGAYTYENFLQTIKDHFLYSKKEGYYDWSGLKYLLFEYEESLRVEHGNEKVKVDWNQSETIEHIYPQTPEDKSWKETFPASEYSVKQRKYLAHSLGNLLLLSHSKNSSVSNRAFKEKKRYTTASGNESGYQFGSHSEVEVSKSNDWTPSRIYKRGMKIMTFLARRWDLPLNSKQMKELLLIDNNLMKQL